MQKKFITNLGFLLVLNFLIKPFYILGIDAEIINRVGAETYGVYFTLFNFSFLFNIVLDLGINNYSTTTLAKSEHLLPKFFSRLLSLKVLLLGIYVLFTLLIGLVWGYSNYEIVEKVPAIGIGGEPPALHEGRVQRKVGREWSDPPS